MTPDLAPRELELLQRVARGASYTELAREWGIAEISVRGYGHRVLRKFGAASIAHAVYLACVAGVLDGRPQRHGDHAGFMAHWRRGEEPCDDCHRSGLEYRNTQRSASRRSKADRPAVAA